MVVDGALLNTAQIMQMPTCHKMPTIVSCLLDAAHSFRTTCSMPLHDAAFFSEQYGRLFDQRLAVLNGLQNSTVWQGLLEGCKRHILKPEEVWEGL